MKKLSLAICISILLIGCTTSKQVVEQTKSEAPKTELSLSNENDSKKPTEKKPVAKTPKVKSENDPPTDYKKTKTVAPVKLKNAPKAPTN